jgi:nudix-type nucleoside diphosphatase (YffH/AdpP family)
MADELISAETVREGWFDLVAVRVKDASGTLVEREIVGHPSGAAVLPYDPERKVALLITEARPPVVYEGEPRLLEAIAGALEEGSPEECARREALEEGGLKLGKLVHLGRVWMTPSTSTERVDLYLGEYDEVDRVAPGGGLDEEDEHVRVKEVPLAVLWAMVEAGDLRDAKTLILLQALRIRRPDLF